MKLLFCPLCRDVLGLIMQEWRICLCGKSGGQYNVDGMTATIGGDARVFGVGNPFFEYLYPFLEEKGKRSMWKKYYGHELGDCWWGMYPGDLQIFCIEDAKGPRLKVKIRNKNLTTNTVIIVDKRSYTVDGQKLQSVDVPKNPQVKTRWVK